MGTSEFQKFVDAIRMPVFVMLIIAAPFVAYFNRASFEALMPSPSSGAPSTVSIAAPINDTSGTSLDAQVQPTPTQAQPATTEASGEITLGTPLAIPKSVTTGEIVPFSFVVTNNGTAVTSYPYKVYVLWQNGEQDVLDRNSISLQPGASMTIPESLKFENATDVGTVTIELLNTQQSIHFTMPVQ